MLEFKEVDLDARAPVVSHGGAWQKVPLVQRTDPLTMKTSRILTGVKLQPEFLPDLETLTDNTGFCPFCDGTIENVTFPFEKDIVPIGRIRKNRATIVPNIMAYSTYSSVVLYDTSRHFLRLSDFTPSVLNDAFSVAVEHSKLIREARPDLFWSSISANYLPSSGSSVIHPHLQTSHDAVPMQAQRDTLEALQQYCAKGSTSFFQELMGHERNGDRYIAESSSISWLTPFAPRGFQEIWGVFHEQCDIVDMDEQSIAELSDGLSRIFRYYESINMSAFNYSIMGGGPSGLGVGHRLTFRILARSNPEKYYRSDVTYFERLLDEPLIDVAPESVASAAREFFNY